MTCITRIDIPERHAAAVEELLELDEAPFATWRDWEAGVMVLEGYSESHEAAEAERERLTAWLAARLGAAPFEGRVIDMPDVDWQEAWKEFFHAARVSPRLVVGPPWEPVEPPPNGFAIVIDPGMSFGTGQHATTRLCLRLIDEEMEHCGPGSFCDVGCGSGILSIAAWKLGYGPILALDYDAIAVRTTRENLAENGVPVEASNSHDDRSAARKPAKAGTPTPNRLFSGPLVSRLQAVCVREEDAGRTAGEAETFDLVVANMLATRLTEHAEGIARRVRPGGRLILSGAMRPQYAALGERYARLGFAEERREDEGEWSAGVWLAGAKAANSVEDLPGHERLW